MDKEVGTVALVLIAILAIFVAVQPLLPASNERFSELGVLGPNQTIAGYPTIVAVGHEILLYGYIGNHEGDATYYDMIIKLGNQSTQISNSTSANAPIVASYFHVLGDNQSWTFPVNLSMASAGINQRLIFELWSFNETISAFSYTGLWNQLWINVTAV
jgi:uncharacterized membrane protein